MTETIHIPNPPEDSNRLALELDLARRLYNLGPDIRDGLLVLIAKAESGHHKHGKLNIATDPRDFMVEALEERQDETWYLLYEILKLRRRNRELEAHTDSQWRALRREAEASVAAAPVMISDLHDEVTP